MVTHRGGCHCGRVRFEVDAPRVLEVVECNCSFYVPRSHPDGISVSARCLDPGTIEDVRVTHLDGAHWEANAATLDPLPE